MKLLFGRASLIYQSIWCSIEKDEKEERVTEERERKENYKKKNDLTARFIRVISAPKIATKHNLRIFVFAVTVKYVCLLGSGI